MNENKTVFENEFNVYIFLRRLWLGRRLFLVIVSFFALSSIIYSLIVDPVYEVTATIQPAEATDETTIKDTSPVMGFAMTGYSHLPVINSILITLNSDSFFEIIYNKYKNEEKLFDDDLKKIDESDESADQKLYLKRFRALKILHDVVKTNINGDYNTITFSVKLKDKYFAYEMIGFILESLRNYVRSQNIENLEADIKFYQQLTEKTSDPRVMQIIDKKLSDKIEKKFILSSNVFTIVDKPTIPAKRVFPKRSMIVIITTVIGSFIAGLIISLKPVIYRIIKIIME